MSAAAELCRRSEEALLLSQYGAAEALARQALAKAAYLAYGSHTEGVADRAATVAIQALAETERFGSARKLLRESFGPSLQAVPPNALLVWLAFAVDTGSRGEAQREILALLDSRQPGSTAGWSRRQFLTLAHLYVFEVLLREVREVAEVMRWVQNTELPLEAEERQLLLDELEDEQAQQVRQAHSGGSAGGGAGIWGGAGAGSWGGLLAGAAAAAVGTSKSSAERRQEPEVQRGGSMPRDAATAAPAQQQQQQRASPGSIVRPIPPVPAAAARTGAAAAAAAAAGSRRPAQAAATSEIEPADDPDDAGADPAASSATWLGQWQRQLAQLLSAVLAPLLPSSLQPAAGDALDVPAQQQQHPGAQAAAPAPSLPLLGSTVLGAVLLYAAYAERRAIQAGARRAQRGVLGGLGDMMRMAFSMQINPLASTAAGYR